LMRERFAVVAPGRLGGSHARYRTRGIFIRSYILPSRTLPVPFMHVSLTAFNSASPAEAAAAMLACCASRTRAGRVAAGRPYAPGGALGAAIESAFARLTWDDVLEGMSGHPRIGDRVTGTSAAEQSGVTDASRAALMAANREYEARFG